MSVSTMTRQVHIAVYGLGYGPAVQRIENELARVPGVTRVTVLPSTGRTQVSCAPTTHHGELLAVLGKLGFRAELLAA